MDGGGWNVLGVKGEGLGARRGYGCWKGDRVHRGGRARGVPGDGRGRGGERHADTVRRLCLVHLRSYADTEDVFQTVFVRYARREEPFESPEHERAWFVRVTINACHGAHEDEVSDAHDQGLSYGKYRMLLQIQELDPSVTADDVRDMTMREMRELLVSLGGEDSGASGGSGKGHEGHHGGHW